MRNLKKFLAMALTVLMVVGSFAALSVNAAFDDVTDYQEAIDVMNTLGIIKGYDEKTFGPDDDVTRWQMALLITKMMTGKVSDEYVETNLKNPENFTAFTDITADNYIGAISYANNNGIVKGYSADKYGPKDGIMIQDVFTMVVRMLGYGSTAMDNNYPWSFIDKAISLGLDDGLPADYSNEATATRGEVAQILFNALTAVKADASSLGADFFNLQKATVVITGTKKGNMYNNAAVVTKVTPDGVDYVAFSKLSPEGTVDSSYTYYIPKTAFGLAADANANAFVGDSFVVRTNDDFASFLTCDACDKTYVDQDALVGTGTSSSDNNVVTINGDKYSLVKSYTYLNNGQGAKSSNTELILNNANGVRTTSYATDYVLDKDLNILDENGKILLYWVTTYGLTGVNYANLNGIYLYKVGEDANGDPLYVEPNDYIWSMAGRATLVADSAAGFGAITKSYAEIEKYDAYSTTVLYDDDADGDYDRGVYYQFQFGKAAISSSKLSITTSGTKAFEEKVADLAIYDPEGKAVSADSINGKYVLYYYQKAYKTVIIKEVFAGQTGLVTGINLANKTLTLNALGVNLITGIVTGENYSIGNAKLFGATFNDIVGTYSDLKADKMIGKNINFIEKDGKILAIYNYADSANYMVFVNDNSGFTTMGYKTALVYFDPVANKSSNTRATVTFNATSTFWYSSWTNVAVSTEADKYEWFKVGDLLTATKDALGNYDAALADYDKTASKEGVIVFQNGIMSNDLGLTVGKATSDTVIIVFSWLDMPFGSVIYDNFQTFKGVPANNAAIDVYAGAKIKYVRGSNGDISFLYINGGKMDRSSGAGSYNVNPWNWSATSTIIYVDGAAKMTQNGDNVLSTGAGMYLGTVFDYTNVVDAINGGYVDVKWSSDNYSARLETGNFYYVKDGYVVNKVDLNGPKCPIQKVFIYDAYKGATKYETRILVPGIGGTWVDNSNPYSIKQYDSVAGQYYVKITDLNTGAVTYRWNEFNYENSFATIYLDTKKVATNVSLLNTKSGALLDILSADGTAAQKAPVQDNADTPTHRTGYYAYAYVPTWTWEYETNVYRNSEWPSYEYFPVFLADTPDAAIDLPASTGPVIKYAVQIKGYDQDETEAFDPTAAFQAAYEGDQIKIFKALQTAYGNYIKGEELEMDAIANLPEVGAQLYPDNTALTDDVLDYAKLLQNAYVLKNTIVTNEAGLPAFIIAVKNDIAKKITISYEIQVDDPTTAYESGEGDNSEVINIKPTKLESSDLDVNWTYYVVQTTSKMIVHEASGNVATPYIINKDNTDLSNLYAINLAITMKADAPAVA